VTGTGLGSSTGSTGLAAGSELGTASLAGVSRSFVDLEGAASPEILLISAGGVGGDANNLYELSVIRGIFQGNLRSDMQQKIIARDQISAGCGSYFRSS